jgi:hypothetical protein
MKTAKVMPKAAPKKIAAKTMVTKKPSKIIKTSKNK